MKVQGALVAILRYPDENEYNKFLSQNGGSCNAFTSSDHTNYFFDISPDKLEGALDRYRVSQNSLFSTKHYKGYHLKCHKI